MEPQNQRTTCILLLIRANFSHSHSSSMSVFFVGQLHYVLFVRLEIIVPKKEQKLKLTQINFNIKLNKRFINNKRSLPFSLSCRFLSSIGYDSTYAWSCVLIFLFLCVYKMIFVMCRRDLLSIFPLFISSVCFTRYVCV